MRCGKCHAHNPAGALLEDGWTIFEFSAGRARIADCLAEGVEFELSGDFLGRSVRHAKASRRCKETRCQKSPEDLASLRRLYGPSPVCVSTNMEL